jgi:hypothetical protein
MSILNNTNLLQDLLDAVNALPEAGVDLPELSNEASASDLLLNKQLIDGNGNIVTGTMSNNGTISSTIDGIDVKSVTVPAGYTSGGTVSLDNTIDNEVNTQADLLAQAVAALEGKAAGSGSDSGFDTVTGTNIYAPVIVNYTNANGECVSQERVEGYGGTITVAKNTLVIIEHLHCDVTGDVIGIPYICEAIAFFACGDFEMDNM